MDDQASRTVASSASVSMPESERRIPSTRCTAPRSSPFANVWETSLRIARSASARSATRPHDGIAQLAEGSLKPLDGNNSPQWQQDAQYQQWRIQTADEKLRQNKWAE